ncbi:MAG: type III PLP-dependent enzyme [Alphaproteobacteria bacterium]|nr:type III PLP-dependent enzyme [Alphaproteobacteria bacterium]
MVASLRPEAPVHCLRPHAIARLGRWFVRNFPGDVMYAVKTNPDPKVLTWLHRAGIRHFDAASLAEVRSVAKLFPEARIYFMHPVKSREAIAEAYFKHGVRHFALDSHDELQKILHVTGYPDDLALLVRLSIPNDKAAYALSGKFGVKLEEASSLFQATRKAAALFGVCFHVGSQCMDPQSYITTLGYVRDLLTQSDVRLDMLDVGGGFPSVYPGMTPPPLSDYMQAIRQALAMMPLGPDCRVLCEPGRALVAEGGSTVARVELRKGRKLYLNDGAFGSLFDAAHTNFRFPVRGIRPDGHFGNDEAPFTLFGPTCDSMDVLQDAYVLPADIREGDWIEIGQLGAYGATMRTQFNGFHTGLPVEVADDPLLSVEL